MRRTLAFLILLWLFQSSASAHAIGENYVVLNVRETSIDGVVEIFVEDLETKFGISIHQEGLPSQSLVDQTAPVAIAEIRKGFSIGSAAGDYPIDFVKQSLYSLPEGMMVQYFFTAAIESLPEALQIRHDLLYKGDPLHRGLLVLDYNAKTGQSYGGENAVLVFSRFKSVQSLDLNSPPKIIWKSREMIPQGILHIWVGIDHILFLLALLIPTVLVRTESGWKPATRFSSAGWNVLKIVTVFTIAHSVTLALAALDLVSLPSRLVESVIALSIALVALNNIFRKFPDGSILVVFGLGLFHGLGFASVMGELPFRTIHLLRAIIGFNIGVEIGQIAIVLLVFPALFLLRSNRLYEPIVVRGGSAALIMVAGYWFAERAFALG